VRELQHAVERAVILTQDPVIQLHAFDAYRYGLTPTAGTIVPGRLSGGYPVIPPPPLSQPAAVVSTPYPAAVAAPSAVAEASPAVPAPGRQTGEILLASLNVNDAERVLIQKALEATVGNRTKAAELLGISVRTLRNKLNAPADEEDDALS
jgi:DNA-binding NtrC family response regulator